MNPLRPLVALFKAAWTRSASWRYEAEESMRKVTTSPTFVQVGIALVGSRPKGVASTAASACNNKSISLHANGDQCLGTIDRAFRQP